MYNIVLFDLDGTLTDPAVGITNSVEYSLKKFGIETADKSELCKFIGPPLHKSFQMFYGFSEEKSMLAVEYYREYYRDKGIFENKIYDGIKELLIELKGMGKTLAVATSKPEVFARQILEHFEIAEYFSYVAGANLDGTRTDKSEVISYALHSCGVKDKSKVIMIGDREHDIIGAKNMSIASVGVLFGYGSLSELKAAEADYIAKNLSDILPILAAE